MLKYLGTVALGGALSVFSGAADAMQCGDRQNFVDRLQAKYSETLTGRGLQEIQNGSAIVEVWSSPETGTFTVLLTNAYGQTCIVAAGTHWNPQAAVGISTKPKGTAS